MSELRVRRRIQLSPAFVIDVFDHDSVVWAVIENKPLRRFRCWSSKNDDVDSLAQNLVSRLASMEEHDAFLLYLDGWERWAAGVPAALASLVFSGELSRARAAFLAAPETV